MKRSYLLAEISFKVRLSEADKSIAISSGFAKFGVPISILTFIGLLFARM